MGSLALMAFTFASDVWTKGSWKNVHLELKALTNGKSTFLCCDSKEKKVRSSDQLKKKKKGDTNDADVFVVRSGKVEGDDELS